jgi:hypothetical protein
VNPLTLADVARMTLGGDSFDRCLANFLDSFYTTPSENAWTDEPAELASAFGNLGRVQDAYLAAAAEELANRYNLPPPAWARSLDRALQTPWFATPMSAVRAVLLLESPPAFRARNLFVSENALSRV